MQSARDSTPEDDLLRRYLLGRLTEAEREDVERRLFEESGVFERVEVAEMDLVESYARGLISPDDRARFETHYLITPERCRYLELIRSLIVGAARPGRIRSMASAAASRISPWWAAIAAALLVAVTALSVGHDIRQSQAAREREIALRNDLAQANKRLQQSEERARQEAQARADLQRRLSESAPDRSLLAVGAISPVISLKPSVQDLGPGRQQKLSIPPVADPVRFCLELPPGPDSPSFRITLESLDRDRTYTVGGLRSLRSGRKTCVTAEIPASLLVDGDYRLFLYAGTAASSKEVAVYTFRATHPKNPR